MNDLSYSYLWLPHSDTFSMYRRGRDFIWGRLIDGEMKVIFKHKEATDTDIKIFYRKFRKQREYLG
jgi:hypothetical protein